MNKRNIIKWFVILIILFAIYIIFKTTKLTLFFTGINIKKIVSYIRGYGKFSILILLTIYAIKPFTIIFPTWTLGVASGVLYGWFLGYIISLIGCFISATVGYYVAKFLGRDFVLKFTKGKFEKLDKVLEKDGFKILFLMRLPVVFPYDALSLACGLTSIRYKDFILASVLGVMPEMFAYNYFGNSFSTSCYRSILVPISILVVLVFISFKLKNIGNVE